MVKKGLSGFMPTESTRTVGVWFIAYGLRLFIQKIDFLFQLTDNMNF